MKNTRGIVKGQISIFDFPCKSDSGCRNCICRDCLQWWSGRCPYGECYDNKRALDNPYDTAHPGKPPRTWWSSWKTDQAFWCRGGITFPAVYCEHYVKYLGSRVEPCLGANIQRFQDGFIRCGCGEDFDCTKCYRQFEEEDL